MILFLGPSGTFITGGVLVVGSGMFFIRQTKDEIELRTNPSIVRLQSIPMLMVIAIGLVLGLAHSFIFYVIPKNLYELSMLGGLEKSTITTYLLIFAALVSFPVSIYWSKRELHIRSIHATIALTFISAMTLYFLNSNNTKIKITKDKKVNIYYLFGLFLHLH